jgi:uncharacterized protein
MIIELKKKPKNPTIIEGFPGFGLVSTIATEFLLDHLKMERIGSISTEEIPAMIAVHDGKVIDPIGIFYNRKYNLVIVHAVSAALGIEWKLGDKILDLAKQLGAKEIISLEGIGSTKPSEKTRAFYHTSSPTKEKKLSKIAEPLKEGIIMGLTGVLMLKAEKIPVSCIFAEAHSELPDSKAAAKIVEILNDYLGLKLDPKPLIKQAEKFEEKLKQLLMQTKEISEEQKKKKLTYVG